MKTIGMIGGMSWESTLTYYRVANEVMRHELGGYHSAWVILTSVDFAGIEECQREGDWERAGKILSDAAIGLERAGVDFIVICSNTMHIVAQQVMNAVSVPVIHIAKATIEALRLAHVSRVALLGTTYTMEHDYFTGMLVRAGIEVFTPDGSDRVQVNNIIFNELCYGDVLPESKLTLLNIIDDLADRGAEGVILGCTELGMAISQSDTELPVFDTTLIHAKKAAALALKN